MCSRDCGAGVSPYDRVETVDRIGRVGDDTPDAVGLDQAVTALYHVAIASFLLRLVVACVKSL